MANFTGSKCICCGEIFKDGDDVVVCPECGTPYHRDCYMKEGRCINTELHEKGQSWTAQENADSDEDGDGTVRCIRCGFENPSDKLFCEKCGTPLMKNMTEERPFNNDGVQNNGGSPNYGDFTGSDNFNKSGFMGAQGTDIGGGRTPIDKDTKLDGITVDDYAKYIGKNPILFLSNFIRFSKFGGKTSLNICAFLFPEFYFFFRKMNMWGVIFTILSALTSIPAMIEYLATGAMGYTVDVGISVTSQVFGNIVNLATWVSLAVKLFACLTANYLYFKKAKRDINEIRNGEFADEELIKLSIAAKGGTSWAGVILGMTLYFVVVFLPIILMGQLM